MDKQGGVPEEHTYLTASMIRRIAQEFSERNLLKKDLTFTAHRGWTVLPEWEEIRKEMGL